MGFLRGRVWIAALCALFTLVGTAQAVPTASFSFVAGTSPTRSFYAPGSPGTVWVNSSGTGTFIARITASDPSGIRNVLFPGVGTGFTGGGTDTTPPYEMTYSWTVGASAAQQLMPVVTANDNSTAQPAFFVRTDVTAPTGVNVGVSDARTGGCQCGVAFTWQLGTDSGSGIAQWYGRKQSAPLDPDTLQCGSYSSMLNFVSNPDNSFVDTGATTGHCYRYSLLVRDNVGNSIESAPVQIKLPEPTPPAVAFDGFEPLAGEEFMWAVGSTLYVNPQRSGSVRLHASAAHPSGISIVSFPAAPGGWSTAGFSGDTDAPYEQDWSWVPGALPLGLAQVTALSISGMSATDSFSIVTDGTPPSGGAITYANRAPASTEQISFTVGTDAGVGIDGHQLLRRTAAATANGCGAYSTWAPIGARNAASPFAQTGFADGTCYQYALQVTDLVGNVRTYESGATLRVPPAPTPDPTPPAPTPVDPTPPSNVPPLTDVQPIADTPRPRVDPAPPVDPVRPVRENNGFFFGGSAKPDNVTATSKAGNTLVLGAGNDRATGNVGNDELDGGPGNDVLRAGAGADILGGGSGNDTLDGGTGSDQMVAGVGADVLLGGAGRDLLVGGAGKDKFVGGPGDDVLLAADKTGGDTIDCGAGVDTVSADKGDFVAKNCERFTLNSPKQNPTGAEVKVRECGATGKCKVDICHAAAKKYVTISVDVNAAEVGGHGTHAEDLIPAPEGGCPAKVPSSEPPTPPSNPAGGTPPTPQEPPTPTNPLPPLPPSDCAEDAPVILGSYKYTGLELVTCNRERVQMWSDPFVMNLMPGSGLPMNFQVGFGTYSIALPSGAVVTWSTQLNTRTLEWMNVTKGSHSTTVYAMGNRNWGAAPDSAYVRTELTRRDLYDFVAALNRCSGPVTSKIVCRR